MPLPLPSLGVVTHATLAAGGLVAAVDLGSWPAATGCFAAASIVAVLRARRAEKRADAWRAASQHDPLTGVGNYRKLHESLAAADRPGSPALRAPDARRRLLQAGQRDPRPPGGRPPAPGGRPRARRERPRDRRRGPPGRRRVQRPAARGRHRRRHDAGDRGSRRRSPPSRPGPPAPPSGSRCARRSAWRCSRRTARRPTTCSRAPTSTSGRPRSAAAPRPRCWPTKRRSRPSAALRSPAWATSTTRR